MRKVLALLFGAILSLGVFAGAAYADHDGGCQNDPSASEGTDNPATGGYIYADGDEGSMSGHIGAASNDTDGHNDSYIEVSGSADDGLTVHGRRSDAGAEGSVTVNGDGASDCGIVPEA